MRWSAAAAVVLLGGAGLSHPAAETVPPAATAILRVDGGAAYHKHPLVLELEIVNGGETRIELEPAAFGPQAFTIVDEDGQPPRPSREAASPGAGLVVDGYATMKRAVDLTAFYPRISAKKKAVWNVTWEYAGLKAGPLRAMIIQAHDPERDRIAIVETSMGRMTWTLLPSEAPRHVKRFVDLSRQGFYDGLTIFRVIPGLQAEGGDTKGDGTGAWQALQPPEFASEDLPLGLGLVGSSRQETSMTSDTMFFITLGPSDFMKGLQTFFARVTSGLDIVVRMQRLESRGDTQTADAFMLIEPVRILRIEIR